MGRLERFRKLAPPLRLKRFSLRSLLLCVLLLGSGFALWFHWGPWEPVFRFGMVEEDDFAPDYFPRYDQESDTFYGISNKGFLTLWDGANGTIELQTNVGERSYYHGRKQEKEKYLYIMNDEKALIDVFDLCTKSLVAEISLPEGSNHIKAVQSDNARWLACCSDGTLFQIRDTKDWTVKCEIGKKPGKIYLVGFSANSDRVQSVTPDQTQYWDLEHGTKLLEGSSCDVASPSFESYLEFLGKQPPVIRSIPDDEPPVSINVRDTGSIASWRWVGNNAVLGFRYQRSSALVIDASTGEITAEIKTISGEIQTLALPDGRALALIIDSAGRAQALDLPSGQVMWSLDSNGEKVDRVTFGSRMAFAYTVSDTGTVHLWDPIDGGLIAGPFTNGYGLWIYVSECADYWRIDTDSNSTSGRSDFWRKDNGRLVASFQWGRAGLKEDIVEKAGGMFRFDRDPTSGPSLYRLSRPTFWYGFLWLPEFYLTLVLALGLAWSLWRDRKL